MGSPKVNVPTAPAAPQAVDPGAAMQSYLNSIASPELQAQLFGLESQYRPQYTALNQRDLQNTLLGVAGPDGFYGTLDLNEMAAARAAAQNQGLLNQQREFEIAQLSTLGPQAQQAYLAANPGLAQALGQATALGGQQQNAQFGQMAGLLANAPQQQNIMAQQVAPGQVNFQQVQSGGVLTPAMAEAERIQAERVASGQVQAGTVQGGDLGSQLYQQALQAQQQSPLSAALGVQGLRMANAPGQLTPEEQRAVEQQSREAFAARGLLDSNRSIAGEVGARIGAQRDRQQQDIATSLGINQQLLGAQQMGQQLATDVLKTDISRQAQNVGNQLGADQFNVSSALQAALANQGTSLEALRSNQQTALQASLANQQAINAAQQFNITNAQNVQQTNQAAGMQTNQFNAQLGMQGQLANQQANMAASESNRAFNAQQQQNYLGNLGNLGQLMGNQTQADRGYALQLAGLQQGIGQGGLSLLGSPAAAMGYGAQQQQIGMQQGNAALGPRVFDPNAGINLALQNNANTANYNASIYGSQAAAAGAGAQARGSTMGGLFQGLGAVGAAFAGLCWVAREVYGDQNPRWMLFRDWLSEDAPKWLFNLYRRYGERFAGFISDKPRVKNAIRKWMDARIYNKFGY